MRGGNFEDTLKMALGQLNPVQIDAIKEVDEDCYDNSNYNSIAKFEPLNESMGLGGSKGETNATTNAPWDEKTGESGTGSTKRNFGPKSDDEGPSDLPRNPIMTVMGPSGSVCKNVMNNISQTTKIIINNIGGDFKKKREKADPQFEGKGSEKEGPEGNPPSWRTDKNSGERRSWVNYNFSRPISKRSSEDPSQNEFVVKDLPRRTSTSIESYAIFRNNDGEERKSFLHEFNPLRRASFRETREHGLDFSGSDAKELRKSKRFIQGSEVLGQRRSRFLSSTLSHNVVVEGGNRPKKPEKLDIRSCLFGGPGRRPEGVPKEGKRVSASVLASFRK